MSRLIACYWFRVLSSPFCQVLCTLTCCNFQSNEYNVTKNLRDVEGRSVWLYYFYETANLLIAIFTLIPLSIVLVMIVKQEL